MKDIEKLGAFYLGRLMDPAGELNNEPLLYDAKDLTTHAVCVGMTGSGKTGLGVTLLEEAAIDGIPAIVIDPKGDMGNLLLTFPELSPSDFEPWIDPGEAARKGCSVSEYAGKTAENWRMGLTAWGQNAARVQRFRASAEAVIYTPGTNAGRPLSILRSFSAPPPEVLADATALRDRILTAVSGMLSLVGISADPIQSREHILISTILERAWREERNLDMATLINQILKPPFDRVGVFDLETFFPAKNRMGLAMTFNNLIASPGFAAWTQGEPLNIQRLLWSPEGNPRISILSISHLSEAERLFFVTILLNEVVAWMRSQPGTSSLRALLYMDEIFGYFPPTAEPPSKRPMLTLLKQARAFGLGVVLATQNPVDLDYKGLSNTGTWFIGRLQTEQDRNRLIEGLLSASDSGDPLNRQEMESLLSGLGSRVFLMRNVHEDRPALFQTRWALSYLRGPLTLPQIRKLAHSDAADTPEATVSVPPPIPKTEQRSEKPPVSPELPEYFLYPGVHAQDAVFHPFALGRGQMHFIRAKAGVDLWRDFFVMSPFSEAGDTVFWDQTEGDEDRSADLETDPPPLARYAEFPAGASGSRNLKKWGKAIRDHVYQTASLELFYCKELKIRSVPGETRGDFLARISHLLREKRDVEVEKLREKFAPRLRSLEERIGRARAKLEKEEGDVGQQKFQTAISVGSTLLGAIFGRKLGSTRNIGRATSAVKSAGRISKEKDDVRRAQERVEQLEEQLMELEEKFNRDVDTLEDRLAADQIELKPETIRPRKSDIAVREVGVVWTS